MRYGLRFAPSGLVPFLSATHGLGRGLQSFAASRLGLSSLVPQGLKPRLYFRLTPG